MKTTLLLLISLFLIQNIYSETLAFGDTINYNKSGCEICKDSVPDFLANLDGVPDSIWISPQITRSGNCCNEQIDTLLGTPKCLSIIVYLDKDAVGLKLDITDELPANSLFYRVNCGPEIPLGEPICLAGGNYYSVTFCNPGDDIQSYSIHSVPGIMLTDTLAINGLSECSGEIHVKGLINSSIQWSVKYPAKADSLINYLDLTDIENPLFYPDSQTPSLIIYTVCGYLTNTSCKGMQTVVCEDVTVIFNGCNSIIMDNNDLLNETLDSSSEVIIYPNPNSGIFSIEFSKNSSKMGSVEIYNSTGALVLKKVFTDLIDILNEKFDLSNRTSGIYYLRINSESNSYSKPVIIRDN